MAEERAERSLVDSSSSFVESLSSLDFVAVVEVDLPSDFEEAVVLFFSGEGGRASVRGGKGLGGGGGDLERMTSYLQYES